jgi:hypothetical protein
MTTITPEVAVTARHEPPQGPGARACQSCASFGAIAISGVLSRLADISGRLREITARDEAASARAVALPGKDGAR